MNKGDYVLATKWRDGDPKDHWVVGFFDGMTEHSEPRYDIVDNNGILMRGNGFRRVEAITAGEGAHLLKNSHLVEMSGISLWEHLAYMRTVDEKGVWA